MDIPNLDCSIYYEVVPGQNLTVKYYECYHPSMGLEYQPLASLRDSRNKLRGITETQVEIPDRVLFEGIVDVLASRVGMREWRTHGGITLMTRSSVSPGIAVSVRYTDWQQPQPWRYDRAWISTREGDDPKRMYYVQKEEGHMGDGSYVLYAADPGGNEDNDSAVSNYGNLAPARLFGILANAHWYTKRDSA